MAVSKEDLDRIKLELQQRRDELALKLHLGKAEAKEEWEKLEARWEAFESKLDARKDELEDVVEDASENVEAALEMAAEELKKGYQRLRGMF